MHLRPARREVLRQAGSVVGVITLGGCLFGSADTPSGFGSADSPRAGTLVITNDTADVQTVTVAIEKTSTYHENTGRYNQTPTTTPIWEREEQFRVEAATTIRRDDYLTEPGAYFVEARLDDGRRYSTWVGLYPTQGGGVGEDAIYVDISEDTGVFVSASHSD